MTLLRANQGVEKSIAKESVRPTDQQAEVRCIGRNDESRRLTGVRFKPLRGKKTGRRLARSFGPARGVPVNAANQKCAVT
jgi:hypothetical protein